MIALVALLVFPAAGLLAWGVMTVGTFRRKPALEKTLAPYTVGYSRESNATSPSVYGDHEFVRSPILQRAIDAVAEAAARRGLLAIVEAKIDQADIPVRPAEALFLYLVVTVLGGLLVFLVGNVFWGAGVFAALVILPWVIVNFMAIQRTRSFVGQLPDMLQLLGATLRSGFSILQGLDTVAVQLPDPMGKEMRHVVAEARLGRPLASALDEVAQRVKSEDFEWVVSAIGIQREVGGNLSELLDIVAETMNARSRLRQEAHTLTAEGRIGAIVISLLPVGIGVFIYATNHTYLDPLLHTGLGQVMFYGCIAAALAGMVWMRNIVKIEI
jgi:tight adherence protein B